MRSWSPQRLGVTFAIISALGFSPAAVKKATNLLGEDVGDSRYPVLFSESEIAAIKEVVEKYRTVPTL